MPVIRDERTKSENEQNLIADLNIFCHDWVAVKYEDDCYFGQVLKREENRLYIKFISKSVGKKKTVFEYPLFEDEMFIDKSNIVCKITTPVSNGKYLIVSDYCLQKARKKFLQKCRNEKSA